LDQLRQTKLQKYFCLRRRDMTIQELQTQLLSLTRDEKSSLINFLSNSLESPWRGINKTLGVMGGEACIRDTRIPVWLLVSYLRMGLSEAKLLDNYPSLSATDLANAWSYNEAHRAEIDRAIARQDEE
jgi:uncharacterized protein (DUF433 family)